MDLNEILEGERVEEAEREMWVSVEACVGTLTLFGWWENKVEILG